MFTLMTLVDYFLASHDEITQAFPGWTPSPPLLGDPYTRKVRNPFTREVLVLSARGNARFGLSQTLPPDEHLPDLEPMVARLFAQLDR